MIRAGAERRAALVLLCLCAAFPVRIRASGGGQSRDASPPTHREAAERALTGALVRAGIPEGKGAAVTVRIEGAGRAADAMLGLVATEFLVGRGFTVAEGDAPPGFVMRADSLAVTVARRGMFRKTVAERTAEAAVEVVFRPDGRTRMVYRGRGAYRDTIPSWSAAAHDREADYVVVRRGRSAALKPVLFGLVVTGLVWLLYSYRG